MLGERDGPVLTRHSLVIVAEGRKILLSGSPTPANHLAIDSSRTRKRGGQREREKALAGHTARTYWTVHIATADSGVSRGYRYETRVACPVAMESLGTRCGPRVIAEQHGAGVRT